MFFHILIDVAELCHSRMFNSIHFGLLKILFLIVALLLNVDRLEADTAA